MVSGEIKGVSIATLLVALNVLLMAVLSFTPVAAVNAVLFEYVIVGLIVYGALLSGGLYVARTGVENGNTALATVGVMLIQTAYGLIGSGLLSMVSAAVRFPAIVITGVVATMIAAVAGALVYGTGHDFSAWGRYANYVFMGVFVTGFLSMAVPLFGIVAFFLALAGFIIYLVHQIYVTKTQPDQPYMNAIGLYTAYMGVFVEILKLVISMLAEE